MNFAKFLRTLFLTEHLRRQFPQLIAIDPHSINPLLTEIPILYPLKTPENQLF